MAVTSNLFKYEILHVNIRSARSNKLNLEAYLAEMDYPEVICLNETKLARDGLFEVHVFFICNKFHSIQFNFCFYCLM